LLQRFKASESSVAAFARENGVKATTFYSWLRIAKQETSESDSSGFLEVDLGDRDKVAKAGVVLDFGKSCRQLTTVQVENALLRHKIDAMAKRMFGKKVSNLFGTT
jgi:transposase-like protein